jgi:hypothetical protein
MYVEPCKGFRWGGDASLGWISPNKTPTMETGVSKRPALSCLLGKLKGFGNKYNP